MSDKPVQLSLVSQKFWPQCVGSTVYCPTSAPHYHSAVKPSVWRGRRVWSVWGGSWQEEWSSGGSQPQPWLPGRAGLLEAQVLPAGRTPWARGRGACRGSWVCQLVKPPAGRRRGWSSCGHVSLGAALDVPVQGDSSQSTGHHSNHPGNRCHQAGLAYPKELYSNK